MPHYYFDIEDGHSLVDPSGSEFNNNNNDDAAGYIGPHGILALSLREQR
jgi:hypothetical protein